MTDSFFGFDTHLPVEDDGGGGIGGGPDDSEEEYDALNDETFGQAREGDWEELHEDMVRLDQREGGDGDSGPDSELEMNFSSVRIDNLELDDDNESEARLQLDPSVWTMPSKPETPRPQLPHPAMQQHHQRIGGGPGGPFVGLPPNFPLPNPAQMRICSVEEIEQNMIKQQAQHSMPPEVPQQLPPFHHPGMGLPRPPPGFPGMMNHQPPLTIPVNFPPPLNMVPPLPPLHLLQTNVPPPFPMNVPPPNFPGGESHANFNQRLVQEIQQNHPMLNQHRQHQQQGQNRYQQQHNNRQNYHQNQQQMQHHRGKLNRSGEYDEYANLMSERDKQWLLAFVLNAQYPPDAKPMWTFIPKHAYGLVFDNDTKYACVDPFFDDIGVKSLNYLDTLFQRDNQEKAKFYKGLQQIINKLPARMNINRILPYLTKEFVSPTMIPFVLPNVFSIAKLCNQAEFEKHIFVHLKSIMSLQEPVQILLIFMQNMELMLKLTSPNDVKMYVLPMMYKALESNSSQIQELCLEIIPSFAYLVDFQSMKNSLLPRIKHICNSNGPTSMRVNCLLCIGKLLPHLDKWVCLDEILLFLPTVSSREPAVIMALIGIFKVAANHELLGIPKEFCVRKVLPFLWPLSIENGLTLQQYNTIMAFIKDLEKRIETEHKATLQQLDTEDTSALPVAFDQRQDDVVPTNLTINNRDSKSVTSVRPQTSLTSTTTTQPLGYPSLQPTPKQTSPPIMDMFGSWSMNDTSNQAQQRPLLVSANNNFPGSLSANYLNNNGFGSSSMPLAIENASNKFQRPLLANLTNPDKLNTNYKPNNGNGSSNSILTKEDILEFLK